MRPMISSQLLPSPSNRAFASLAPLPPEERASLKPAMMLSRKHSLISSFGILTTHFFWEMTLVAVRYPVCSSSDHMSAALCWLRLS